MAPSRFAHDLDALKTIASDALAYALEKGASACDAEASDGYGQTVTVRKGEVETIEYNRDKSLAVTVYVGKRKGDRKSTRLNSSHSQISYAVFCFTTKRAQRSAYE